MQLHSRQTFLVSSFLISTLFMLSLALAAVADVSLAPLQTLPDKSTEFSLSVSNLGGDNINKVELTVPQQDSMPLYLIKEIGNPAGWTYETRYALGAPAPFKIIWSTADAGIAAGKSLNFNFVATSPTAGGDYKFEWRVVDLKNVENLDKVTVTNFNPTLSDFEIKVSNTTNAGKEIEFAVAAIDQNGDKKPDYTGTIKFSSSDSLAVLPSDYTFQLTDEGAKTFKIKLRTGGEQEITVTDGTVEKIIKINVIQGDVNSIKLTMSSNTAAPDTRITFSVLSTDLYDNTNDVTKISTFEIDKQAKGQMENNVYVTENVGKWFVIASSTINGKKFYAGGVLTVTSEIPKIEEEVKPEVNASMEIVSDDLFEIPFNSTNTFLITVKNTGDSDISNVSIYFSGISDKWVNISPSKADIEKGKSQRFTITISAPEHIEPTDVEFIALSSERPSDEVNASKIIKINVTEPISQEIPVTGKITQSRNLTYLGIAIVIAIVLIILFWAIFLRSDSKKKKSEE